MAEADRKRSRYQDMAAEGLITFEELGEKLLVLEDSRKTAERELKALKSKRDRITELEQDRDALLDSLMQIGSEALDTLAPDEKHQLYRILQLGIVRKVDTPEVSGSSGKAVVLAHRKVGTDRLLGTQISSSIEPREPGNSPVSRGIAESRLKRLQILKAPGDAGTGSVAVRGFQGA